jgi:predicted  nucleic acid-binding Zn-ribbon protein
MLKENNSTKDVEAKLAIIITAFVLALLLYVIYGVVEKGIDPYGAAAIIAALLGVDAIIIGVLKIRLKRDEGKEQIEQLKQDLQSCKNDLRDSRSTADDQSKSISEKDDKIKAITKDLDEIKQTYEEIKSLKSDLEDQLKTTTNELESAKEAYEKTKNELLETGTKLSEARVQIEEHKKKVSELSSSVESLTQDNQRKEQFLKILTVERDGLKDNLKRAETKIIEYSNSIKGIYARVATTIIFGAHKIEERHMLRTWLDKDLYMFIVKNNGTAPCYRLRGRYIIHRRVGNPIQIPVEYPAIYEGENINFGPTQVQMEIECTGIDVNLEYKDILGQSHRCEILIPPERIHLQRK